MILFWSFPGRARLVTTIKNGNESTDNLVKISEMADKTLTDVTKVTAISTGVSGAAKGTVDILEAVACQDVVCADGLSIDTSFLPNYRGNSSSVCRL
jgi:hypothetical protein